MKRYSQSVWMCAQRIKELRRLNYGESGSSEGSGSIHRRLSEEARAESIPHRGFLKTLPNREF